MPCLTWSRVLVLAGLLLAFGLRLFRLGDQNIWWDEGLSVWAVRQTFGQTTLWAAADVHPPLYFWLLWPWVRLVGESEFAVRFITVMESLLTVALMLPVGRRLGGVAIGVGALWLLTLSRFHIWWSQEMRMYTLAALCCTLSVYLFLRMMEPYSSRRIRWGWVLATAAALYTIYFAGFVILVENLVVLVAGLRRSRKWPFWRRWLGMQVLLAVAYFPWLLVALPRMRSWSVVETPPTLDFVLQLNAVLLSSGVSTDVGLYVWQSTAFTGLAGLGVIAVIWQWRSARAKPVEGSGPLGLLLLGGGIVLPTVMVWAVTQPRSLFYSPRLEARYFLAAAPLAYLLLAWGLTALGHRRWLRVPGMLAMLGVLVLLASSLPAYYQGRYLRDELQSLTRTIWTFARPDDLLVLVSGDRYPVFRYYYDRDPAPSGRPAVYSMRGGNPTLDSASVESELGALISKHQRIWLVQVERNLQDPDGLTEAWLTAHFPHPLSLRVDHNTLFLFTAEPGEPVVASGAPRPQHPLERNTMPVSGLVGYDLAVSEYRPGEVVRPAFYIDTAASTTKDFTVYLTHASGLVVGRRTVTAGAVGGLARPLVEFRVAPYWPAGEYHFAARGEVGQSAQFGTILVTGTERPPTAEEVPHPVKARLGDDIDFLGFGVSGPQTSDQLSLHVGEVLQVDLFWQAERNIGRSYKVFSHLVGSTFNPATNGPVWVQQDQEPLGGRYLTTEWLPARPLRDRYDLKIAAGVPPGDYLLEVGMYAEDTGERLPVTGERADSADRRLILMNVKVLP